MTENSKADWEAGEGSTGKGQSVRDRDDVRFSGFTGGPKGRENKGGAIGSQKGSWQGNSGSAFPGLAGNALGDNKEFQAEVGDTDKREPAGETFQETQEKLQDYTQASTRGSVSFQHLPAPARLQTSLSRKYMACTESIDRSQISWK